jgi:hypothetical protein
MQICVDIDDYEIFEKSIEYMLHNLDEESKIIIVRQLFKGLRYANLRDKLQLAIGNSGDKAFIPVLREAADKEQNTALKKYIGRSVKRLEEEI